MSMASSVAMPSHNSTEVPVGTRWPLHNPIFGQEPEETVLRTCERLRSHNPVPVRVGAYGDGWHTRNLPIDRVIDSPTLRSPDTDCLLQIAGLVAHALLWREEPQTVEGLAGVFDVLDRALNRRASRNDPQGWSGGEPEAREGPIGDRPGYSLSLHCKMRCRLMVIVGQGTLSACRLYRIADQIETVHRGSLYLWPTNEHHQRPPSMDGPPQLERGGIHAIID